jgi:hypothetical protein
VRSVLAPGVEDSACPSLVTSGPDQGVPVRVEKDEPATRTKHASKLPQHAVDVIYVLDDLDGYGGIETGIGKGEHSRVAPDDRDPVVEPRFDGSAQSDRVHLWADVDRGDGAAGFDLTCYLTREDARPGAEIEYPLAGARTKGTTHRISLRLNICRRIRPLEPSRRSAVIRKPRHV